MKSLLEAYSGHILQQKHHGHGIIVASDCTGSSLIYYHKKVPMLCPLCDLVFSRSSIQVGFVSVWLVIL